VQDGADWSAWGNYNDAVLGFRNYWYPTIWASEVGDKPVAVTICGERITLIRDGDTVRGLHDRCPHRGVPLSLGRRQFPGTVSCPYHGWTFDLETGDLAAVLTDGPDSPICGRVKVATYPVEERFGLLFVYIGDVPEGEQPPPVERDIPDELNHNSFVVGGRNDIRVGNWRFAAENGFDEGHAKYLHNTALWRLFKVMPAWNKTRIVEKDGWLVRVQDEIHWEAEFPGVGTFTNKRWWKRMPLPDRPAARPAAGRLPAVHPLRVVRPRRRRARALRAGDGQVRGWPQGAAVQGQVPRRDPVALPRPVHRPGRLDGRRDGRSPRAALPPGPVADRLASAHRAQRAGRAADRAPSRSLTSSAVAPALPRA
jgi:nitrite reductase/ring-hydroxylating ferredoxin subunit